MQDTLKYFIFVFRININIQKFLKEMEKSLKNRPKVNFFSNCQKYGILKALFKYVSWKLILVEGPFCRKFNSQQ